MAIVVEIIDTKQNRQGGGKDISGGVIPEKTTVYISAIAYDDTDPLKTPIERHDVQFDLDGFLSQYKTNAARLAAIDARMNEWGQTIKAQTQKTATLAKALVGRKVTIV